MDCFMVRRSKTMMVVQRKRLRVFACNADPVAEGIVPGICSITQERWDVQKNEKGDARLTTHRLPLMHYLHGKQCIRKTAGGGFDRKGR